ncbi:MAG: zinc metallopeptidase [Ruminococcaceae bacterium]|nr:zinc metallopeptidase [Oscillospiraceae bacterium]
MPYFYGFDYTYLIFCLPPLLLALWAQYKVKSTFAQYSKVASDRGMTGRDAARLILDTNGLYNVPVSRISGELTDHFDPRENVIRLSDTVCDVRSAAAVGVAAHEAGHAVQYAVGYGPMKLRSALVPVTNIGSRLSMPLVLLGILLSFETLAYVGVILFSATAIFQLVTLPVEFDASRRALAALEGAGMSAEGVKSAKKVLSAAALTYVAALLTAVGNLLRLLVLVRRNDDRR